VTADDDGAFGDWRRRQVDAETGVLREIARLTEWREAALEADRADYERAVERTWRGFADGLAAATAMFGAAQMETERFWLAEVKPYHTRRPDPPEVAHDGDAGELAGAADAISGGYPGPPMMLAAPDDAHYGSDADPAAPQFGDEP
jgi:hypothetical protein